jgi:tripartite ATP-independent transporter DctP family solute receptor
MAGFTRRELLLRAGSVGAAAAVDLVSGVSLLSATMRSASAQAKKITIRLVHDLAAADPRQTGALRFAELAAKYTNGEVEVQVFPNHVLATEQESIRQMRNGSLAMGLLGGNVATIDPIWAFFGMPYLFTSYEAADKVFESETGRDILGMLPKYGLVGLSFFCDGFRDVTNSRNPIVEPKDMAGLKIRVPNSESWIATFKALGANPTPMDFGQLYMALKTKVVDAQEAAPSTILTQKFYEGQSYLSLTGHIFQPVVMTVSKTFWDGLPKDVQAALQKAATESARFDRKLTRETSDQVVAKLRSLGIKVNEVDKPAFIKQTESVYTELGAKIPGLTELVQKIRKAQA